MTAEEIKAKLVELRAKRERQKVKAEGGKVSSVGVFGKLGSSYSPLYAPNLLIATTLTGQLAVLMLIEQAESIGIPVVSANTDGVVYFCPRDKSDELDALIATWEINTGFTVERTPYRALYNSSVNSYIAVKENGSIKRKGPLADPWSDGDMRGMMQKNPQMTVCSEALVRYIKDAVPFADTIRGCTDPRMFVTVTRVAKAGTWRGHRLGRTVRFYYSTDGDPIFADDGSRKVSKTDGARPLLELTDALPADIDYDRYIAETVDLAVDLAILDAKPGATNLL